MYDPTAAQAVSVAHDTPVSPLFVGVAPAGGVLWIVQLVPSQRSTKNMMLSVLSSDDPTAVQAVADVQDTPLRPALGTLGVFWIVQLVPSQRSTRGPPLPALSA
jgi:hypothetical protein